MPDTLTAVKNTGYLLDGKFCTEGRAVEIRSPYNQKVVGVAAFAGPKQVEAAIAAAVRGFEVTRKLPSFERQRVLLEIAQQISARHEEFALSIALESRNPIPTSHPKADLALFT